MAANPAYELADLLESLQTSDPTISRRLKLTGSSPSEIDFWRWHAEALATVERFEQAVEALKDAGHRGSWDYGRDVPRYYRAIWETQTGWSHQAPDDAITTPDLDLLRAAGDVIAALPRPADLRDSEVLDQVITTLTELLAAIDEAGSEEPTMLQLRLQVQQALRFARHIDVFGPSAVMVLINDVTRDGPGLVEGSESLAPEAKGRVVGLLGRLGEEVLVSTGATMAVGFGAHVFGALLG